MWEDQDLPVGTWYKDEPYHVPGGIPIMHINVSKPGLDNPTVRRAIAYAINYAQIAETAMSRYSEPAYASLIVPKGAEEQFFNADTVGGQRVYLGVQPGPREGDPGDRAWRDFGRRRLRPRGRHAAWSVEGPVPVRVDRLDDRA